MRVVKYLREGLYGFCEGDDGQRVFFHLEVFIPEGPAPPVVGELVDVEWQEPTRPQSKAPRATTVTRVSVPQPKTGKVQSFNVDNGWGFIIDPQERSYFLHRCEVEQNRLPLQGQQVEFYSEDARSGKEPRACHVRVL